MTPTANDMTEAEKQQFIGMQGDIQEIKQNIKEIYSALMGSDVTGAGGLHKRLATQETESELIKKEIRDIQYRYDKQLQDIRIDFAKSSTRLNIIWVMAGALAMALLKSLLS